jgi:hypothetical protein
MVSKTIKQALGIILIHSRQNFWAQPKHRARSKKAEKASSEAKCHGPDDFDRDTVKDVHPEKAVSSAQCKMLRVNLHSLPRAVCCYNFSTDDRPEEGKCHAECSRKLKQKHGGYLAICRAKRDQTVDQVAKDEVGVVLRQE